MQWNNLQDEFELEAEGCFVWLKNEYTKINSGRVNPSLFNNMTVNAYDAVMKMNELANIQIVDARQIMIKPYDTSVVKNIAVALHAHNINANVQVNPDSIRVSFAPLTEESRKNNVKEAKIVFENAKIKLRNIRQDIQSSYKKDPSVSDDDKKYFEEQLNKLTKELNAKLEAIFINKEKELITI